MARRPFFRRFPGFRPPAPFLWSRYALPPERAAPAPPIPAAYCPRKIPPFCPWNPQRTSSGQSKCGPCTRSVACRMPVPEALEGPVSKPSVISELAAVSFSGSTRESVKDKIRHSGLRPGICKSHPLSSHPTSGP